MAPACDGAGVLYPGPQLRLLILLAITLLVGLGVREWRAGFPDAAERLERFDREDGMPLPAETPAPVSTVRRAADSRREARERMSVSRDKRKSVVDSQ